MGIARYFKCPEYGLSLVSANAIVPLNRLGIPFPTRAPFVPYSVVNVAGNKLAIGDGFPTCQWEYADAGITRDVWIRYNAFLSGVASAYVYLRTQDYNESYSNWYGVLRLPTLVPVGYGVQAWQPFTISFTGLVQQ